jgi:dTDP-4-dehydrorhamnose reductase
MDKLNVLIIGGSGFLGSILMSRLNKKNIHNIGTYNTSKQKDLLQLDVTDFNKVESLFSIHKPNVIVWAIKDMRNERVLTERGLNNVFKHMPNECKFIYLSTNVFNDSTGPKKESDEPNYICNGHHADDYIIAKIQAEKRVKCLENYIIIRPGVIYGKNLNGEWDFRMKNMINELSKNKHVEISNKRMVTWVNVKFLADAIVELIVKKFVGIIHIGSLPRESGYSMNRKVAIALGLDVSNIRPLEGSCVEFTDDTFDLSLLKTLLDISGECTSFLLS